MDAIGAENGRENRICQKVEDGRSLNMGPLGDSPTARKAQVQERPTGSINKKSVMKLLEWQGFRCALTGRTLSPDTASLDHIIPVSSGGDHVIENTQVVHRDVNKAKTTMNNDVFVMMCREVVQFADAMATMPVHAQA